jgi:flagellar basal-body rod protein FlgB
MFLLNKPGFNMMERALDASALRQKVIANNVANVDTPYFKRSDVKFEEFLQGQLGATGQIPPIIGYRTDPRHFFIGKFSSGVTPEIKTDEFSTINNNLNNVDMDYEMSLMAKNQLKYNVVIQEVNAEFKKLRTAMNGGR